MSDFAASLRDFAAQAASERRSIWPCRVTLADGTRVSVAKSATKLARVPQEQGAGWIQQSRAQFNFAAALAFKPDIGGEWVIFEYADFPPEVGTRWRCIELVRAEVGSDHVATCIRLD